MAIALLALEGDERATAARRATATAHQPPQWRRTHSRLDKAAQAVARHEAQRPAG